MARRRAWVTPNTPPPEAIRGRLFEIANDPELVGAVTGALLPLTHAENWEQLGSMTADAAAAIMSAAFEAFVNSDGGGGSGDCPDCELPEGEKVWRHNPDSGHFEYLNADLGVWEFPDGDPVATLPTPTPREELTDEEKLCNAAANAVWVLYGVWQSMLGAWDNEISPALAQIEFGTAVAGAVGGAFYPPIVAIAALTGAAFTLFYQAFDFLTIDTWDGDFLEKLKCIFHAHATLEEDDSVTFNVNAIIWDLNMATWANLQWLMATAQLQYIVGAIGPEGVNVAGGTTAIENADCSCGSWARQWEHGQMHEGSEWTKIQGVIDVNHDITPTGTWPGTWAAVTCTLDLDPSTVFRQVSVRWSDPAGGVITHMVVKDGSPTWVHSGNPDDAPYSTMWTAPKVDYDWHADLYTEWTIEKTGSGTTQLTVSLRGGQNQARLIGFRFYGDGLCPFETGVIL